MGEQFQFDLCQIRVFLRSTAYPLGAAYAASRLTYHYRVASPADQFALCLHYVADIMRLVALQGFPSRSLSPVERQRHLDIPGCGEVVACSVPIPISNSEEYILFMQVCWWGVSQIYEVK